MTVFENVLARLWKRNIVVLAFTPPWDSFPGGYTDDDGTATADYDKINEIMRGLEKKYPNVQWMDINNKGSHDLKRSEHFKDGDHLSPKGAEKLTRMIDAEIQRLEEKERSVQK